MIKNGLIITYLLLSGSLISQGQVVLYNEDFEDGADMVGYQLFGGDGNPEAFQSANSATDYILRGNVASFTNMTPSPTGFSGQFIGFEDVDVGGGVALVPYIQTDQINISGYSSLTFEMRIAAPRGNDGNRYEVGDEVRIEASVDGGSYVVIGRAGGAPNKNYYIDVSNNGISGSGDDVQVTQVSRLMSYSIAGTGSTLDVRVYLNSPDSQEEVAIDDIIVRGVFTGPGPGTWDGSTSTDWNTATNWSADQIPTSSNDVTIPSAPSNQPHVTLDPANPAVCNNITIESGATLTIDAGKALTVSGDTDNEGTILIEADATGIGSFIDNGTITGSGSFQMEQYLTGSGGGTPDGVFYYVSSPIPNATAADYNLASGNRLWIDDEVNTEYPELTFGAIPLEVGQGYIARMGATGAITFDGSSFNTGNITEGSLTRTGTTDLNRGYNLVGNPYPSTVNWDDLGRTNLETTMWYRTNNGGTMTFDTYNATGMVGTNNNGGGTVDGTIPPTQAFWVRVDADGNTGSLAFENADRSHGTLSGIYKAESEEGTIRLSLSNGTIGDEQVIYFDASANDALDDYDSRKFWSASIPQLYSNLQEDTLTINGMNDPLNNPTIPLGMKLPSQGNYSLDATSITLVSTPAILEDTYLNVFQDLNAVPNYNFTSDAGNIGDRFILHFNNAMVGVEEESKVSSHVFATNGQLNISLSPNTENSSLQVLDMAGRTIATRALDQTQTVMDMNVPTGIYLIRIETTKGIDTHKIIVN